VIYKAIFTRAWNMYIYIKQCRVEIYVLFICDIFHLFLHVIVKRVKVIFAFRRERWRKKLCPW